MGIRATRRRVNGTNTSISFLSRENYEKIAMSPLSEMISQDPDNEYEETEEIPKSARDKEPEVSKNLETNDPLDLKTEPTIQEIENDLTWRITTNELLPMSSELLKGIRYI